MYVMARRSASLTVLMVGEGGVHTWIIVMDHRERVAMK